MTVPWGDITRGMDRGKLTHQEISARTYRRTKRRRKKKLEERRWTVEEVCAYLRSLRGDLR